jgi:hypothetical protein
LTVSDPRSDPGSDLGSDTESECVIKISPVDGSLPRSGFLLYTREMKTITPIALSAIFFLCSCAGSPKANGAGEAVQPSPDAISIEASQSSQFPMTAKEKKKTLSDFKKALVEEEGALTKKERVEMKAFSAEQAAAKKNWLLEEKAARRKFFEQHMSGPARREYIQDYLKRKTVFDQGQKSALTAAKASWKEKRDYLKKFQKERSDQFKASVDQDIRPNSSLWPKK